MATYRAEQHAPASADQTEAYWAQAKTLHDIMEQRLLIPLFQPIVAFPDNTIYGYEALIRGPSDSVLHTPDNLFDTALRTGQLSELDLLCLQVALQSSKEQELTGKLFLNINPASLLQPDFKPGLTLQHMAALGIAPKQVVMEITEHTPIHDYTVLHNAALHYKTMGLEVAIDDLGAGYSGLRLWSELRPGYVKIDMHFVQGIHEDLVKRKFVQSIHEIAQTLDCRVIAEGIETKEEYLAIREIGIPLGQGHYFARPHAIAPRMLPQGVVTAGRIRNSHFHLRSSQRFSTTAALITERAPIRSDLPFQEVADLFCGAPHLSSIPVVREDNVPVGLVRRNQFMNIFSSRYGRELHGKKPITRFMDKKPLIVDQNLPLEKLSKLVTSESELQMNDEFIITARGQYTGVGTLTGLLRKITDLQVRNARYANPLTLLPGSVPINECLDSLLQKRWAFVMCYCDLDNFKPFNDIYGYARGDEAIKLLANILVEHAHDKHDFVGHIGGDDFIMVFLSQDWQQRCRSILQRFEREILRLYDAGHCAAGGMWAKDRRGHELFYPIMSLSIAAVEAPSGHFSTHHEISARAGEIKHQAKSMSGNSLFIDRRAAEHSAGQLPLLN